MDQKFYMGAGAALLLVMLIRGKKRVSADASLSEGTNFYNASDWQGTAWQRIEGADLGAAGFPNMGTTTNASPSRNTVARLGLSADWNGNL